MNVNGHFISPLTLTLSREGRGNFIYTRPRHVC